jgi:chemotaxis family two-component system response regulator Rcp1
LVNLRHRQVVILSGLWDLQMFRQPSETSRPVEILLAEDNPGDVMLMEELFRECSTPTRLHVVRDGQEALSYLSRRAPFADAVRPDLVLLDLNLPKKDGRQVLANLKADVGLRSIPVVVLTSSSAPFDVAESYAGGASCVVTKAANLEQLIAIVRGIEAFWLKIVTFPPPRPPA